MSPRVVPRRRLPRRSRQRGVLLGIVLVLIAVLFAAGALALWSMRGDTGSAGADRLSRQLFDCAEQGLAWGKQYFATTSGQGGFKQYLAANICTTPINNSSAGPLPCWTSDPPGPFPTGGAGVAVPNYPAGDPFTKQIQMDPRHGGNDFEYTVGIYNDPGDASGPYDDGNGKVVVYSRCTDLLTMQQRAVQAVITVTQTQPSDYRGQAGRGFRNQGNQN